MAAIQPVWRAQIVPSMSPGTLAPLLHLSPLLRVRQHTRVLPIILTTSLFPYFLPKILQPLADLWESVLRAVPKKKTSYRKKRQRFLAGKALKDVTELVKCPACGKVKRAHILCPFCVNDIRSRGYDALAKLLRSPAARTDGKTG